MSRAGNSQVQTHGRVCYRKKTLFVESTARAGIGRHQSQGHLRKANNIPWKQNELSEEMSELTSSFPGNFSWISVVYGIVRVRSCRVDARLTFESWGIDRNIFFGSEMSL